MNVLVISTILILLVVLSSLYAGEQLLKTKTITNMCNKDRICPVMNNCQSCCQTGDCTFCGYYYKNNSNELEKCKGCPINLNLEENADKGDL